jgi:ribosomal protein S18 acetylase RimI-like enzyme
LDHKKDKEKMGEDKDGKTVIREARIEDLEAIVALLDQLGDTTTLHGPIEGASVKKTLQAMLELPAVYRIFVAVWKDRIVGLISLLLYKTLLHEGGTALINELVVSRSSRGRGIGRQLVEKAITTARAQGMDEIEVGTEQGNQTARRFYRLVGFDREYVLFGREF